MDKERRQRYYILFEKLIDHINNMESFDHESYKVVVEELCELFRISKGVSEFYRSFSDEKLGNGEILCDYDNGKDDVIVIEKRLVTPSKAIVKGTIYQAKDEIPMTDEEKEKVDLLLRSILAFIGRMRLQRILEEFAFCDDAGYPNLRSYKRFLELINEQTGLCGYTVGCYNLRHFSIINREIGRELGDVVFKSYFNLVSGVVGEDGIVCRLGGDNFILVFRNEYANQLVDIFSGVPVPYDKSGESRVEVSASAGFYEIPEDFVMHSTEEIMERIIPASQAARHGENEQIVYFDEKMIKRKAKSIRIQRMFPEAIAKKEFHVFYQPKVNINTGALVGAEALCRWFHDGRIVSPAEFIPVLEQGTDICKLDFYMLDLVCADLRRWIDEGKNPVRVSVNMSRKHLVDVDLLRHILEIVDRYNVPHNYVEVELTETTTDVEFKDLKRVANGLQMEGICTSVDDFGVGYSSLNLIREIPWNILKIDRCFLPEDDRNQYNTTTLMFKHVVSMAHEIGLECVTEGVETKEQVDILRHYKCDIAQGFYFDKPLPLEEFEKRMEMGSYKIEA